MDRYPSEPLAAGASFGSYKIDHLLGRGSLGDVYMARERTGRPVALRILPADAAGDRKYRNHFDKDVRAAIGLTHPHIGATYETGDVGGQVFVAAEYVDGATLADWLAMSADRLPATEVVALALQMADALSKAHAQHMIHGGLSTDNVFSLARGHVKFVDFGMARRYASPQVPAGLSPEQAEGRDADARSDLFALGAILYELTTRVAPFPGETLAARTPGLLNDTPKPIARIRTDVPDGLSRVVERLLEKDPRRRYQTAEALRLDLQRVQRGEPLVLFDPAASPVHEGGNLRLPGIAAIAAVVTVAMAAAAYVWWPTEPKAPPATARSILVLPATVSGSEAALEDIVARQISDDLVAIKDLDVKAPLATADVKALSYDEARLASVYGADAYVSPKIAVAGDRVSVTVVVTAREPRRELLNARYDGTLSTFLPLMLQAAEGIRVAVRPASAPLSAGAGPTTNSEALLALAQGQKWAADYRVTGEAGTFRFASESLTRALELDPKLSVAAGEMADLHVTALDAGTGVSPGLRQTIETWGVRATDLDPNSSLGWSARAAAAAGFEDAFQFATKAMASATTDGRMPLRLVAWTSLPPQIELALARQASTINPLQPGAPLVAARAQFELNQLTEALESLDMAVAIQPGSLTALWQRAAVLTDRDMLSATKTAAAEIAQLRARLQEPGTRLPEWAAIVGEYMCSDPRAPGTHAIAARIVASAAQTGISPRALRDTVVFATPVLAGRGDTDAALRLLDVARTHEFVPAYDWLKRDERLAPLRSDPRFVTVLNLAETRQRRYLELMQDAQKRGLWPASLDQAVKDAVAAAGLGPGKI